MKRDFQRHLADLDEAELRQELQELYTRFEPVRQYYRMELSADTEVIVNKYKKKIRQTFFPGRGRGKRARSQSSALIKEFQQASIFPADVLALKVHRAEMMVEWVIHWYNESNAYFDSITKAYTQCCAAIVEQQLEERYQADAGRIARRFQDYRRRGSYSLLPIYTEHFGH